MFIEYTLPRGPGDVSLLRWASAGVGEGAQCGAPLLGLLTREIREAGEGPFDG
jgi:hypothetical protein